MEHVVFAKCAQLSRLFIFGGGLFFAVGALSPAEAVASCAQNQAVRVCSDINDPSSCADAASNGAISWECPGSTDYVSAKVPSGLAAFAIDVPVDTSNTMACRYVKNKSATPVFVPFRSPKEWNAFIANHPLNDIELKFCGRPTQLAIGPDVSACNSPSPAGVIAYLPSGTVNTREFRSQGATKDYIAAFTCSGNTADKALQIVSVTYLVAPTGLSGNRASNDVVYTPNTWVTSSNFAASGWTPTGSSFVVLAGCGTAWKTPVPGNNPQPNGTLCATNGSAPGVNVIAGTPVVDGLPQLSWTCSQLGTTLTPQNTASVTCTAPITASCGPANGTLTSTQPSGNANLCTFGTPQNMTSSISGGKHIWSWTCSCAGTCTPGYTTASCSASDSTTAQCGTANGQSLATEPSASPSTNLCLGGTASGVTALGPNNTGPWSWTCTGSTQASCSAKLSAGCGSADGTSFTASSPPTISTPNLCAAGNTASAPTGSGPWSWECMGSAGETASCSALLSANGVCGSDNGKVLSTPPTNLCSPASSPTVTKTAGGWSWKCPGSNGGSETNCSATEAPSTPACGPGAFVQITCNDPYYDVPPPSTADGKCSNGTPSAVVRKSATTVNTERYFRTGQLYWEWTCTANGTSIACQVPICSCPMCGFGADNTYTAASSTPPTGLSAWDYCMNGVLDPSYGIQAKDIIGSIYYNPNWTKWWIWNCKLVRDDGSVDSHTCHTPRK